MPTGYTAAVRDGTITDFAAFALRCARAFGATIMQRDDDPNDPPKFRSESAYYRNALAKARAEVDRLGKVTVAGAALEAKAEYQAAMKRWEEARSEMAAVRERYADMLAHVLAWNPPTTEHQGLRDFMEQQLRESIKFDCHDRPKPKRRSGTEWLAERRQRAARDVAYYAKALHEEEQRVASSNGWILALYQSLGVEYPHRVEAA